VRKVKFLKADILYNSPKNIEQYCGCFLFVEKEKRFRDNTFK